jgi:hypothetical protein
LTEDTIQQPTKKESRRRSHSNEHDSVSPKRHKSKIKEGKDTEACKDSETEEPPVSVAKPEPEPEPIPEPEPEPEPEPSAKEIESEIENEKCIEQGDDLLASTYVDFQETADKLLDVKSKITECEANTWEDNALTERKTQSSPTSEIQDEGNYFKEIKEEPPAEEPIVVKNEMKVEESTSDSESSEVMDKHNVVSELKFEPQMPKERPAKKGSIFKSRATSGEKRQAHYIHKWCDVKELEGT